MSEAELHVLRARLDGGIRNKAARGELRRGLPVGFVWGEKRWRSSLSSRCGRYRRDSHGLRAFRRIWFGPPRLALVSLRALPFPLQDGPRNGQVRWVAPTYTALHHILTNPVYAGAYAYGKTRWNVTSMNRAPSRNACVIFPSSSGPCFIPIIIPALSTGQPSRPIKLDSMPTRGPQPHQAGGAVREGAALLQGLATCGHCGRRLHTHLSRHATPLPVITARGKISSTGVVYTALMLAVSGIDQAVADAFLKAVTPGRGRSHYGSVSNNSRPTRMRLCLNGVWKSNGTLRSRMGRAPLPSRGAGESARRSRIGGGMGKASAAISRSAEAELSPPRTTTPART